MNVDLFRAHRGLLITALKVFKKAVEDAIKREELIEADTSDTERMLDVIERLNAELVDQRGLLLEGTPMGDQMTTSAFTSADGLVLTADVVDAMLRNVGIDAPFDAITGWTLAQREEVNAYVQVLMQSALDGTAFSQKVPDVIREEWLTGRDDLLEREMPEGEVDEWIITGPWGVRAVPGVSPGEPDEWQIHRMTRTMDGDVERVEEKTHDTTYGQLDRARLIAANLNVIEQGKALADAHATEAQKPFDEEGATAPVETTDAAPAISATEPVEQTAPAPEPSGDDLSKRRGRKKKGEGVPVTQQPDPYA